MAANKSISIVLGTMTFGWSKSSRSIDAKIAQEMMEAFAASGHKIIDTALIYMDEPGISERMIATAIKNSPTLQQSSFEIHTKAHPADKCDPLGLSQQGLENQANKCLANLECSSLPLLYLHSPDPKHQLKDTLEGCNNLFKQGKIGAFGLSNYTTEEVAEAHKLCSENGWLLPSVYQGSYNAINRAVEKELLPTLKELNIAFYAYNPLAAGLLSGKYTNQKKEEVPTEGRFGNNENYQQRYWKDDTLEAMNSVAEVAKKHNLSVLEVAFSWLLNHSKLSAERGDAVILGVSSMNQLQQNLKATNAPAPLPEDVLAELEKGWKLCEDDAFSFSRGKSGGGGDAMVGISK